MFFMDSSFGRLIVIFCVLYTFISFADWLCRLVIRFIKTDVQHKPSDFAITAIQETDKHFLKAPVGDFKPAIILNAEIFCRIVDLIRVSAEAAEIVNNKIDEGRNNAYSEVVYIIDRNLVIYDLKPNMFNYIITLIIKGHCVAVTEAEKHKNSYNCAFFEGRKQAYSEICSIIESIFRRNGLNWREYVTSVLI